MSTIKMLRRATHGIVSFGELYRCRSTTCFDMYPFMLIPWFRQSLLGEPLDFVWVLNDLNAYALAPPPLTELGNPGILVSFENLCHPFCKMPFYQQWFRLYCCQSGNRFPALLW